MLQIQWISNINNIERKILLILLWKIILVTLSLWSFWNESNLEINPTQHYDLMIQILCTDVKAPGTMLEGRVYDYYFFKSKTDEFDRGLKIKKSTFLNLPFILSEGNFLNICLWPQCVVYKIHFQSIPALLHINNITL